MNTGKKRKRNDDGGSYRYTAPTPNAQYTDVFVRQATLQKNGSITTTKNSQKEVYSSKLDWMTTLSWLPDDNEEFALDISCDAYDDAVERHVMDDEVEQLPKRRVRSEVSRRPHVVWKETYRSTYLDEVLRFSGRGDFIAVEHCPDCVARNVDSPGKPLYRCRECFLPDLCCQECCVRRHRAHPLHRVQMWASSHFEDVSLKDLGLKIQLNHASLFCERPEPCHASMLVLHTNGIHRVAINYCGCARALPQHIQLLRRGFYPATQLIVKTCATFALMDLAHKLAVCTKGSTYDLYRTLEMMTNNIGSSGFSSRYRSFFRMNMQWRHLKLLKHGGRAQDPTGPEGTKNGELALMCLTCPMPGINLPPGWEDAPESTQFLYRKVMCMDANFRLKNQLVSNYSQDPGLGIGWAYMVPRAGYEAYVLNRASDEDISSCVGFQALAQANNRYSKGLRYTGVGGVFCGRSEMVLPNGVGNLQKGERYANMDYLFASASRASKAASILISYDICCQWFKNLRIRMNDHWPEELQDTPCTTATLTPAIPKLHEPTHDAGDHEQYSLNLIPGAANDDLEGPERVWSVHNPVGNSTKTQGPGSRQDVLDDHFGDWNWRKVTGTGKTEKRRRRAAIINRNIQVEAHRGLTESLGPEITKEWEEMCVTWEKDKAALNPYRTEGVAITEDQAKKELAEEEQTRLRDGGIVFHSTSAPEFVSMALDIEDTQRRLRRLAKQGNETLVQQRNHLTSRIRAWRQLLPLYMPGLLQYQANLVQSDPSVVQAAENPEDDVIWLPSKISESARSQVCLGKLAQIEEKLRTAQCFDALDSIRHTLKIKTRLVKFKNKNLRGQREGTRSTAIIDRVHDKARSMAEKYRVARVAKLALSGPGRWEEDLRPLADADVRGYQDPNVLRPRPGRPGTLEDAQLEQLGVEPTDTTRNLDALETDSFSLIIQDRTRRDGTGETRRTLSWIWLLRAGGDNPDNANDDIMRAEWAKSRARANRAREEVQMVQEDMRRAFETLTWQQRWWKSRAGLRVVDKSLTEALKAHIETQIKVRVDLAERFQALWKEPLKPSLDEQISSRNSGGGDDDDDEDEDEDETVDGFSEDSVA